MPRPKTVQTQSALPFSGPTWQSKGIFSDHFIRHRLQSCPTYPKPEGDDRLGPIYENLRSLWESRYIGLVGSNEETTRREFIEHVMSGLGFARFSNLSLLVSERPQTPDYLLFRDEATKTAVFNESLDTKFANACGLLEAKKVFTPLDAKSAEEVRFPHQQVRDYLEAATDNIGRPYFRWGILSNGNEWRLYCRDSHPSQFFSFHLSGENRHFCNLEEFRAFVTLFSARAFIEESGTCLLGTC